MEFEMDKEVDAAAARHSCEDPMVVEAAERALRIGHIDMPGRVERHPRGEALAEYLEPNDQIGDDQIGATLPDARGEAPGQELRIALDVGNEREELLRRVGEHTLCGVG